MDCTTKSEQSAQTVGPTTTSNAGLHLLLRALIPGFNAPTAGLGSVLKLCKSEERKLSEVSEPTQLEIDYAACFNAEPFKNMKENWTTGQKFDTDKPMVDLLDVEWLLGTAQVLTFGAKKYDKHNWRKGISYTRLLAAALRHLFAIMRGADVDEESGLKHVHHLSCCIMFLSYMMDHRPDLDDRWKNA